MHLQPLRPLRQAFLDRETTRSRLARAFLDRWLARLVTTHSLQALAQALVRVVRDQLVPALQALVRVVQAVRPVPVVQVVRLVPAALHVPVSVAEPRVPVVALQVLVANVRRVVQVLEVVVTVVELPVLSVRAVAAVHPRLVSRSARSAKSLSREWLRASVAQSCHVAMAPRFCACVVVQASKTLPTRLKPLRLS